jgi:ribonuclease M5
MIKVNEVIIVEGRYDKNTLSQFIDGTIIETRGFGIFSDKEKLELLRRLAEKRGLVVLTDSDGAGFVIRNYLKGSIDPKYLKHAYIPDITGKEKRKTSYSKEKKLGVEGMSREVIETALMRAGVSIGDKSVDKCLNQITKADLYELGLSGCEGSFEKRRMLLFELSLPEKLSPNALLDVLNALMSREEFMERFAI